MERKRTRLWLLAASLASFLLVGGTLAAWVVESSAVNGVSTGKLRGDLLVEYDPPEKVYPGSEVDKVVNVKNVGAVDMLARVNVEKIWGTRRGTDGKLDRDTSLSVDNIDIETNTRYWMDGGDGYYYYKGILSPNEVSKEPLFEKFTLDEGTGNDYKDKMADIVVNLECIQAGGNAISMWNKTYAQLGVTAPVPPAGSTATVSFVSPSAGFNPADTDLFVNFKSLVPGETRQQPVRVENQYSQAVEILLRAEFVDQQAMTADNLKLVRDMLEQYSSVTITGDSGTILYQGAVWGNYLNEPVEADSMKNNISLGQFASNTGKGLTVTLTLDPSLDNRYQGLLGLMKWVFVAHGEDSTPTPGDNGGSGGGSGSTTPDTTPTPAPPTTTTPTSSSNSSPASDGRNSADSDFVPIGDTPVPLAGLPFTDIFDDGVPLAGLPKTGVSGTTVLWVIGLVASAWIFGLLVLPRRKRGKESSAER